MTSPSQRLELEPGRVDLWFALPSNPEVKKRVAAYENLLSDDELEQYRQLKQAEHRLEYLLGHALLRTTLARYTGSDPASLRFESNRFGKPELASETGDQPLQFNLAHSNGLVVCAVTARAHIGVDVEYHANSQALLQVADDYFSETEVADLQSRPEQEQDQYFFRYWTLKESFIKAKGEGLSIPLDSFSFRFDSDDNVVFLPPEEVVRENEQWFFELLKISPDYTASLAVDRAIDSLRMFESVPLARDYALERVEELFADDYRDSCQAGVG